MTVPCHAICRVLTTGKLNDYLADLNEQAEAMFSRLVKQLFEKRGRNGSPQSGKSNAVGAEDEQQTAAFPFQAVFNKS